MGRGESLPVMVPKRAPALRCAKRITSELPAEGEDVAFVFNPPSLDGQFRPPTPLLDGRRVCVTACFEITTLTPGHPRRRHPRVARDLEPLAW